jgi:hypothetical protein
MILILIFVVNYPNLVHDNVFSQNIATIEMLRSGGIESVSTAQANLWPGFFFTAGFLMQITGLDIVSLNVLMLSLFVLLMGLIAYCFAKRAYEITKNRLVMYAPLFMWIFLFHPLILYEFLFNHQWYAIVLFMVLIYMLLQSELSRKKLGRRFALSLLVVSTAITITHPITGFIASLTLLLYAVGRRRALTSAALTSACIYVSWWTFVSYTYLGDAWHWVEILLQGGILVEYVKTSLPVKALPLFGVIATNMYRAYFGIATLVSLLTLSAILFRKIDDKRTAGIALVSVCAWLGAIAFVPFGISSDLWRTRIYWTLPFPLATTFTIGLFFLSNKLGARARENKVLKFIKKKSNAIMSLIVLFGLIFSSLLLFETNYYSLYYSPSSNIELSKWVVLHSDNNTTIAIGNGFTLVQYQAVLYQKDVKVSVVWALPTSTTNEILNQLRTADVILYTCHMESELDNAAVNGTVDSILGIRNIIYDDGMNRAYQWGTSGDHVMPTG